MDTRFDVTVNGQLNDAIEQDFSIFFSVKNIVGKGHGHGDVHLKTFDGKHYEFQTAGEFILVKSLIDDFQVQTRQKPWGSSNSVSVNTAFATTLEGFNVVYDSELPVGQELSIDGLTLNLSDGETFFLSGSTIKRQNNTYTFTYAGLDSLLGTEDDDLLVASDYGSYLNISVEPADDRSGLLQGLLGNGDGFTDNDFALRDGTNLGLNPTSREINPTIHTTFADSWRITEGESLFGTPVYQVPDFPTQFVTLADLQAENPQAVEEAFVLAQEAGIPDQVLEDVVYDFLVTGEQAFIDGAAATFAQSISLAVSPSQVIENGVDNLVYTFTRTGNTNLSLTVDYQIGGTATLNTDYTIDGASSFGINSGTITFEAGESTKTLTIDPTADTTVEGDETVSLNIAANDNYTINTTNSVTGTITDNDFLGQIHGYKWHDLDGDGIWDDDEEALEGWTIYLDLNNNGQLDADEPSTLTDENGAYWFMNLDPGTYNVAEIVSDGWKQTSPISEYIIDLKTGQITGSHPGITVLSSPTDSNNDGYYEVVVQLDYQTGFETAEFLVEYDKVPEGWTVNIGDSFSNNGYGGDGGDTSNAAEMQINGSQLGVYSNILPGYETATGGGLNLTNVDDFVTEASTIVLEVEDEFLGWNNQQGIKGNLTSPYLYTLDGQATTYGPVNYDIYAAFNRVIDGNYRIGSGVSQVTMKVPVSHTVELEAGEIVQDVNFGNQLELGQIHGYKWNDLDGDGIWDDNEEALEGWTIYLDLNNNGQLDTDEPSTVTDAEGKYSFIGLNSGTYNVAEIVTDGWQQTSPISEYIIDLKTGQITGSHPGITILSSPTDSNNDGYYEVVVQLDYQTGFETAEFLVEYDKVPEGWTVNIGDSFSNNGYGGDGGDTSNAAEMQINGSQLGVYSNTLPGYETATGGGLNLTNVDDFVTEASTIVLEVEDEFLGWNNQQGIKGNLTSPYLYTLDGQDTTYGPVNYDIYAAFNRVIDGNYRIGSGVSQVTMKVPVSHTVELEAGEIVQDVNFGNQLELGQIHGYKWHDLDGDGIWDDDEEALEGWTIYLDLNNNGQLDTDEPSTVTDENGAYWFMDLDAGSYTVAEVLQSGWRQTAPSGGNFVVYSTDATSISVDPLIPGTIPTLGTNFIANVDSSPEDSPDQPVFSQVVDETDFISIWQDSNGNGQYSRFSPSGSSFTQTQQGLWPNGWTIQGSADLNGDGLDDLLINYKDPGFSDYQYQIALGQVDGSFDLSVINSPITLESSVWAAWATLADADNDGLEDLIFHTAPSGGSFSTNLYMLKGNGDGTFEDIVNKELLLSYSQGSNKPAFGDFNEDEFMDVFLSPDDDVSDLGQAYIAFGSANGFGAVQESVDFRPNLESSTNDQFSAGTEVYDVDLDGHLDLVVTLNEITSGNDTIEVYFGDGQGNFSTSGEVLVSTAYDVLDTNNNGQLDAGEQFTVTDAQGQYAFTGLAPGNYIVEEVVPIGWQKTSPTTNYVVDLTTGAISGSHPGISVISAPTDSNNDGYREVALKLNYQSGFDTAKFLVQYDKAPEDWTMNIGDSPTNNGWKGDAGTQSNDAEAQLLNGSFATYSNDFAPSSLRNIANVKNLVTGPSVLELNVSDRHLDWNNNNGTTGSIDSPFLYALNGQPDGEGPVNYDIYAAFNRVISTTSRIGSGVRQVTIQLPGAHNVNLGAGQVMQNINFGNQPQFLWFDLAGILIDGPISGAKIGFDANQNGIIDNNEPFAFTDESGNYDLDIPASFDTNDNGQFDPEEGNLLAIGGIDTSHGTPLSTPVTAIPGASVVTLLSSLVADLVDQGLTVEEANQKVTDAFSLPSYVDLNETNPIDATNNNLPGGVESFGEMVKVQNFITQTMGLISGASNLSNTEIVPQIIAAITSEIQAGTILNLADSQQLESFILDAGTRTNTDLSSLASEAAQVMAAANQQIDDLIATTEPTSLEEAFAKVQKVALGETTDDLEAVGARTKPMADVVNENTGTALAAQIANAQVLSQAPTALNLSQTSIAENQAIGTEIGTFSTVDPDTGETHTYSFVRDQGDPNSPFTIDGDRLLTSEVLDYETQDTYNLLVQTSDGNGGVLQTSFTINVTDVSEIDGTAPRDTLNGTADADIITGYQGRDLLTGNGGNDQFVYTSFTDAGDIIKDFTVGEDQIVLTQVLESFGYSGSDPIADGYLQFSSRSSHSFLMLDADGAAGSSPARTFALVENVALADLNSASNFVF